MKKLKVLCLFVTIGIVLSLFGGIVSAQVREDTTFLTRGGSSVIFTAAKKDSTTGTNYCSNLKNITVTGLPSGLIGSNYIVSRMRLNEYLNPYASYSITHSSSNYQFEGDNREYAAFYTDYGSYGEYYCLATSMSSSSANSSCSVYYRWNP